MVQRSTFCTLLAVLFLLSGCEFFGVSRGLDEKRLENLHEEILEEIGDAGASSVAMCRTIAFGAKPCGGPRSYLVYSVENTNEDRLEVLVREYYRLDAALNRERGGASDCMYVTRPDTTLTDGGLCAAAQ